MGEKRVADVLSPPDDQTHKRYSWDPVELLKQNKYHALTTLIHTEYDTDACNTEKTPKIPPIFLHNATNHQEVIKDIESLSITKFTTTYKHQNLKINLTNSDDYRKLTNYYNEHKLEYHTFQDPAKRPLSVVLRNIPISLTDNEIKDELISKHSLPILRVTRLLNKTKTPMPLCAVELTPNDNAKDIFNIKEISKAIITVESRNKAQNIPQCHKCQRYGHTKNYCSLKARCVKCSGDHHHSICNKKKLTRQNARTAANPIQRVIEAVASIPKSSRNHHV